MDQHTHDNHTCDWVVGRRWLGWPYTRARHKNSRHKSVVPGLGRIAVAFWTPVCFIPSAGCTFWRMCILLIAVLYCSFTASPSPTSVCECHQRNVVEEWKPFRIPDGSWQKGMGRVQLSRRGAVLLCDGEDEEKRCPKDLLWWFSTKTRQRNYSATQQHGESLPEKRNSGSYPFFYRLVYKTKRMLRVALLCILGRVPAHHSVLLTGTLVVNGIPPQYIS